MLLRDFFEQVYAPKRLRGKSERSFILYRLCIARYSESLGKPAEIADLTNDNILMHLKKRKQVSAATRNKELAELSAMWRLAVQRELHTGWPDIRAENEPQRTPQAWLRSDIDKLLTACERSPGIIGAAPAWLFWKTLVRLCLDTGERIGAVMQCEWNWLESDSIVVTAEVRKGSKRDKWFRLSEDTLSLLKQLRQYRENERIFNWPYSQTYIWNRYKKLLESAELPTGRKCSTHRLRKTAASVAFEAGLDPQELLDHSDRRTTQRYLDPRFQRKTQASDILADWLRNPPPAEKRKQA